MTLIEIVAKFANSHPYDNRKQLEAYLDQLACENGKTREQIYTAAKNGRRAGLINDKSWGIIKRFLTTEQEQPIETDPAAHGLLSLFKSDNQIPFQTALEKLDLSPSMLRSMIDDFRSRGTEIFEHDGIIRFGVPEPSKNIKTIAEKEIVFAIASDLHFGAKSCQITALNRFCSDAKRDGVTHILVPGDIVDGSGIYPGHDIEQYAMSADDQEQTVIQNLPRGFQWLFLGGNHDYSFMSRGRGHNPLRAIETQREDVHFIGFDRESIPLLPGVDAILWHSRGGNAYAKSYKLQNHARNIAFDELRQLLTDNKPAPTVRFIFGGHPHIYCHTIEGGIHAYFCGTFAGTNGLTKQLAVDPVICGLIIHATIKRGSVFRSRVDVLEYPEIKEDYKNYKHQVTHSKPERPIFT